MQNTAINMATEQIWFQHRDADGYITIAKKNLGRFEQYHYKPEDLASHLTEIMGEDVFYSQNTFYRRQRKIENIRQLRSLYVDLDFYIFNYDPDWILGKLEHEFYRQTIPEPNMIIFSGQGVVLIWLIDPVPYKALPLWQAVQNYLIKQLKPLGGDPKAADAARIFRIAGSTSSKNGAEVRVEYRHEYRYTLRDIQFEYLPDLTPKKTVKKGRKKKVLHLFNVYTLHHARLLDLNKIVEIREGQVTGKREIICFLYRYWSCCFTSDPEMALQDTMDLNRQFTQPLKENEVRKATASAEKAWRAKSDKKANETAKEMGYPGAGYRISNTKLIDWLDITGEEQQHLRTIIGTREKRSRDLRAKEQKRREAGIRPMAEYNAERHIAKMSKVETLRKAIEENPDLSNRKLAAILGYSEPTIRRLKKQL